MPNKLESKTWVKIVLSNAIFKSACLAELELQLNAKTTKRETKRTKEN